MSFFTCFWLFPQKEHFSRSPPSPMRAMSADPVSHRDGPIRHTPVGVPVVTVPAEHLHRGADNCSKSATCRWAVAAGAERPRQRTPSADGRQLPALDDLVDDPVLLGLLGRQDLVALDVGANLVGRATGVPRQDLLHLRAHPLD